MAWTLRIYNPSNVQQASVNIPDSALTHLNAVWGNPQSAAVVAERLLRERTKDVKQQQTQQAGDQQTAGEVQVVVNQMSTDWP